MIIFDDKSYQTRSDKPDTDWTGEALFVVPDDSELAKKIAENFPYYDFVVDENGKLIDIKPTERPEPEPQPEPTTDFVTWEELAQAYNEGVNSVG